MIQVIIVDDEPKAIELIASYLSHYSDFELINTFRNGLKALEFLNMNRIDVIFLDINMPHLSGLSLSKMIAPGTSIVFTTAYSEHAVESYTIDAADYLLKPISLERFSKTISRLIDKFESQEKSSFPVRKNDIKTIFIKSGLETHQLIIDDIQYLKKDGNYLYYFIGDQRIMARQSIAEAIIGLNENFIQIQKSYIVNFKKINSINSEFVKIGETQIPIGIQYKKKLSDRMKS